MRLLADLVSRAWSFLTTPVAAAPLATTPAASVYLTAEAQWMRVASVLEGSVQRTSAMRAAHNLARDNLQAAEYALDRLIDELSDVMTVRTPAHMASVTRLPIRPSDRSRRRLAA